MTDKTHRSAVTGKYVTADHAAENPDTTVSESRTRRPAGDYSDLRARAEACPPEDDVNSIWYSEDRLAFAIGTQDRPFVAACSPIVVLGLLGELDRLRGVNHALRVAIEGESTEPIVRTVGDLTARHIGQSVRVFEGPFFTLRHLSSFIRGESTDYIELGAEWDDDPDEWEYFETPLDTPCEVLQ